MNRRVSAVRRACAAVCPASRILLVLLAWVIPASIDAQSRRTQEPPGAASQIEERRAPAVAATAPRTGARVTVPHHPRRALIETDEGKRAPDESFLEAEAPVNPPAPLPPASSPPPRTPDPADSTLPAGWGTRDVGRVTAQGSAAHASGRFMVEGSGHGVRDAADAFRFTYRTLTGDGEIVARVESMQHVDPWTSAGVMIRETLAAGSRHAALFVSSAHGLAFRTRAAAGSASASAAAGRGQDPHWLRLTRAGDTISAYTSADGSTWMLVGRETLPMAATAYAGLAVASHQDGLLAAAAFTGTHVRTMATSPPPAPAPSPVGTSSTFRLLHWNTRHGGRGTDNRYDPERLVNWIVRMNPHVASLNEVDNRAMIDAILSRLRAATGAAWEHHWDGRGNLLVSRYPIVHRSTCMLNAGARRPSAHIGIVVNGRPIHIWSAHLALDGSGVRQREVRALKACMSAWSEARIAAADFNAQQTSAEIAEMRADYVDAWRAASDAGRAVNYAGNCDGCTRNTRIDYVFTSTGASRLSLDSARIFDTRDANRHMPSDHKPLLVTYTVR